MPRRWQSTGSPTATVEEEKFGSFMVHCRRVPAGRTTSRALAVKVKVETTRHTADTASAVRRLNFISHLWIASPQNDGPSCGPVLIMIGESNHRLYGRVNKAFARGTGDGSGPVHRSRRSAGRTLLLRAGQASASAPTWVV